MTYTEFKNEWIGRRIDYDHVYAYQCVDIILEYVKELYGLSTGVYGNAIDYWRKPTAALLTKFDLVSGSDCKQGDIVVLNGLTGNPYGHIGICESQDASNVTILEQNGGGGGNGIGSNAIRTRAITKSRVAGLLRPKGGSVPPPTPPPARGTVFLPSSVRSWALYRIGSGLRKGTSDQIATLAPFKFPPGLTYKNEGWVGDYAIIITTQMFGRGVIWVKGTSAQIK